MRKYNKKNIKRGKDHPNWKGGKYEVKNGYVFIKAEDHPFRDAAGYVPQHRLVMEKHLRRFLKTQERVHHINGIKNDNRIENLLLFKSEGEHSRHHANAYKK